MVFHLYGKIFDLYYELFISICCKGCFWLIIIKINKGKQKIYNTMENDTIKIEIIQYKWKI